VGDSLRGPNGNGVSRAIDGLDEAVDAVVGAAGAGLGDDVGDAERVVGVESGAVGGDGALVLGDGRVGALEGDVHVLCGRGVLGGWWRWGGRVGHFPGVCCRDGAGEGQGDEADGFVHVCEGWCGICWFGMRVVGLVLLEAGLRVMIV
jgi:hypothetical protein